MGGFGLVHPEGLAGVDVPHLAAGRCPVVEDMLLDAVERHWTGRRAPPPKGRPQWRWRLLLLGLLWVSMQVLLVLQHETVLGGRVCILATDRVEQGLPELLVHGVT